MVSFSPEYLIDIEDEEYAINKDTTLIHINYKDLVWMLITNEKDLERFPIYYSTEGKA